MRRIALLVTVVGGLVFGFAAPSPAVTGLTCQFSGTATFSPPLTTTPPGAPPRGGGPPPPDRTGPPRPPPPPTPPHLHAARRKSPSTASSASPTSEDRRHAPTHDSLMNEKEPMITSSSSRSQSFTA